MFLIGLTGGSGSGKSTAAALFRSLGIPTVDADATYHEILREQNACTKELTAAFGDEILDSQGLVCRKKLAATVFGKKDTPALLHTLNAITHKYVMTEIRKKLSLLEKNGQRMALLDAAQLFEANADKDCQYLVGVIAKEELRLSRIMARDALSEEEAKARLNAQKPDSFYQLHCHRILENNGDEVALLSQIKALLSHLNSEVL